jgi:outer membrane receptor protein involved in Fe transport
MIWKRLDQKSRCFRSTCLRAVAVIGCIAVLICTVDAAAAAPPPGIVAGTVKDALQRPLGGAAVRLEGPDGRTIARTTADDQGNFSFTGVAPGTYAVVAEQKGFDAGTSIVTVSETEGATAELALASQKPLDVKVAAEKLEEARINIQPRIGASTYEITSQAIETQPGGANNSLSQILLQAPGVTQDSTSQGGIHVRNEHANLQYRINGVILPEGVSLFTQNGGLSPRFARSIDLITGALPAEYGLRTAGIIDVQTKSGAFAPGGYVGMYGGSFSWLQPSFEYSGSAGRFNYFVTGDYLQNSIGISPATPNGPIHDDTRQGHGFGYFEYLLDANSKVSAILGNFVGHFEIPNSRTATPVFTANGISDFDPTRINERQLEQNYFAVLAYLHSIQDITYQVSAFSKFSRITFSPDRNPDIIFNGIAQHFDRSDVATGLQGDASWKVAPTHTLRGGVFFSAERSSVQTKSYMVPVDDTGAQTDDVPLRIFDSSGKTGYTYSVYVQDAWQIVPSVTINLGLRFDDIEAFTSDRQLSPRLSVVWTPTSATTVHAGYARYFTPPPLIFTSTRSFSKFDNTSAAVDHEVNDVIKPESAHYFDVGASQVILPGWKVGLDVYYKIADNLLDDGQFGAPVFITPFNYQRGYNYGVELTTTYTLGNFSAYGNLAAAQQWAKKITSAQALFSADDLAFIRQHFINTDHYQLITASAGMSYLFFNTTRLSVDMIAGSGLRRTVVHPNDASEPPYQQVNLGITHRFDLPAIGKMQARFDVINLLDNNYELRNGTGVGVFAKQFGPPRGFFGGLRKEF